MNHIHPGSDTCAGVKLAHISDDPPYSTLREEDGGYVGELETMYDTAQAAFEKVGFDPAQRGIRDERICTVWLSNEMGEDSPYFSFLVTSSLLERLRAAHGAKGADLSQDELLVLGLHAGADAVSYEFTTDAMNAINASYYASPVAYDPSARLATLFVEHRPLNVALGALIARNVGDREDTVRIKELASGSKTDHWVNIAEGLATHGVANAALTLSDFIVPRPMLGTELTSQFRSVTTETYSLLDAMPTRAKEERYDALVITYGFDSVWQPEDLCLTHLGDQWYASVYRVKVADWATRKRELLEALRHGQPLLDAQAHDYDGIAVEVAMEPIDLVKHPYARYIRESGRSRIHFPGGLIKRVRNAYETQLKKEGLFVIGDTANFGLQKLNPYGGGESDRGMSGIAARYKAEDYVLAKQILETEYGLRVELMGLDTLITEYLPNSWDAAVRANLKQQLSEQVYNGVMLVKGALDLR